MVTEIHAQPAGASARQQVIDWLLAALQAGELRPGDRLPPSGELCARLGVGRSSVREAVTWLESAGVLAARTGAGTFVRATTVQQALALADVARLLAPHSIIHLLEIREMLEVGVVAMAADRATAQDIANMEAALEESKRHGVGSKEVVDADECFHLAVAQATHNPAMVDLIKVFDTLLRPAREQTTRVAANVERAYQSHERVLQTVRSRDPERAKEIIERNLDWFRRLIVQDAKHILDVMRERNPHLVQDEPEQQGVE